MRNILNYSTVSMIETAVEKQPEHAGFLIYVTLIAFLLAPKYGFLDMSVAALLLGFFKFGKRLSLSGSAIKLLQLLTAILMIVLLSGAANQGVSFDLVLKPIRNILILLLLYPILRNKELTWEQIFSAIIVAGVINSFIVLLQFVFVLKGWDDSLLRVYPAGETAGGLRQPGLSSGYPSSGMLCCIAAATAMSIYFFKKQTTFFWLFLGCLPGVFLSARTAVVLFSVALSIILFIAILSFRVRFLVLFGFLSTILVSAVAMLIANSPKIYEVFYVMFEFVFSYLDDHAIGVRSTDDLVENHYFLPSGVGEWLVGNGKSAWGIDGIPSDVWFVQNLVGVGAIATALYLCAFFYLFKISLRAASGYRRLIIFFAFVMVFVSSFKGSFIFSRFVGDAATLIGVYALATTRRNSIRHNGTFVPESRTANQTLQFTSVRN